MGLLKRMKDVLRGKVNQALDAMEDPIELLDLQIQERQEKLKQAKFSAAKVLGNNHTLEKKIESLRSEINSYEESIKKAIKQNKEDLAKEVLKKKISLEQNLKTYETQLEQNKKMGETLKEKLEKLENEINKLRDYKVQAEARMNTAEASVEVNKILANLDNTSGVGLDDIERKINNKEAMAEGLGEMKTSSLEDQLKKLDMESVNLDDELAKYR